MTLMKVKVNKYCKHINNNWCYRHFSYYLFSEIKA